MLNVNLTAVAREPVQVQGAIPPEHEIFREADVELREPLVADLEARSVGDGVLVRGSIRTVLDAECRRCLSAVHVEVDDTVDLLFEPLEEGEDEISDEVYPLPERGNELDLSGPLREQLLLRVPEYVVCREECRGLCPQCGTDLNETTCECTPEPAPSPWDALKEIEFD